MSRFPDPLPPEGDVWWLTAPIADVLEARIKLWADEAIPGYCNARFGGDCICGFRAHGDCDCGRDYYARVAPK